MTSKTASTYAAATMLFSSTGCWVVSVAVDGNVVGSAIVSVVPSA